MRLDMLKRSSKDIFINMQNEIFVGNILDIGMENYGVVYNLYKHYNNESTVDYIFGKKEKESIAKGDYDSCIMLFSLCNIWLKLSRKVLFKEVSSFLKDNGEIYIWDIDKKYSKTFKANIRVLMPDQSIKKINISDMNILKDTSKESTVKLLEEYFEIIDLKASDNIYYIKARKKINLIEK